MANRFRRGDIRPQVNRIRSHLWELENNLYHERADVYPISSSTWIVVPVRSANDATRHALTGFLQWMLGPGQRQAAALGYLPLPKDVAMKGEAAIARIH
jgi:ABC-type phosphate transport system substrate-binding protein